MSTEILSCFQDQCLCQGQSQINACILQALVNVINWAPTMYDAVRAWVDIITLTSNLKKWRLRVDTIYPGFTVRGNSGSFKPKYVHCFSPGFFYSKIIPSAFPKLQPLLLLGGSLGEPDLLLPYGLIANIAQGSLLCPILS